LAGDLSPFVCQRLDDLVVDVEPVFPWEISHVDAHAIEASFSVLDHDTTAIASSFAFLSILCATRDRRSGSTRLWFMASGPGTSSDFRFRN